MIDFLDIEFITRQRRAEQLRRACWRFAWSAVAALVSTGALTWLLVTNRPWEAAALVLVAFASWLVNTAALTRLRRLVREAREERRRL